MDDSDYRKLLKTYMLGVLRYEGTTFVDEVLDAPFFLPQSDVSSEERDELIQLDLEVQEERHGGGSG